MRVSEFTGLALKDIDFKNRRINVDHKLIRSRDGIYYVKKTKTECGKRMLPMSQEVYDSLYRIVAKRKKVKNDMIIDGYSGFLLLDKKEQSKVALHIENEMRWSLKKYRKLYKGPLPHITPQVLRHTFCTNMEDAGIDIKSLHYLMGHSDAGVTMNVYTHASFLKAEAAMAKIINMNDMKDAKSKRKSG